MKTIGKNIARIIVAGVFTINSACTESGDLATVSLRLADSQQVVKNNFLSLFFPNAIAAQAGDIVFCLERVRFKLPEDVANEIPGQDEDSSEDEIEDSVDFELGEVVIDPQGTNLGDIQIPAGTYSEIEFDLDSNCASGKTIQITNSFGTFSTDEEVTIEFEGQFEVKDGVEFVLPLASIISVLDSFNPSSADQEVIDEELEDLMESLSIEVEDNE